MLTCGSNGEFGSPMTCDNACEAAALTDSAIELIDGLCDFAPGGARYPARQPQMR